VLSFEDKILIKTVGNLKGILLQKLKRRKFVDFLRKLRTTSSINCTAGSSRPRLSQTADNIAVI